MTKIYFIENKRVDLDSSEWNLIFKDGQWSDEGFNLFWRKKDDKFIIENWSQWQGQHDSVEVLTRQKVIDILLRKEQHPQRMNDAFQIIGYVPELF